MQKSKITLVAFLLLHSAGASATPFSVDWNTSAGDGWLTRDTSSGLDWLDVSLTANQNYDHVRTGQWYRRGFRHATREELLGLFGSSGLIHDGFDISSTQPDAALALVGLLGPTIGTTRTLGFVGSDFFGRPITTEAYPIGQPFSALLGKIDYLDLRFAGLPRIGEGHFSGGHPFSNEASPSWGSFLVRRSDAATPVAVSEPPALVLLLLGLMTMMFSPAVRLSALASR